MLGVPAGALLNTQATHVNGFFWELGQGDPADGVGSDCLSTYCNYPAFTRAVESDRWIKGAPGAPLVGYDWRNAGVDNCITGGATGALDTVYVHYIIDSNDDYAIAVLKGSSAGPLVVVNLDLLVTGVGPNGNDVPMVSRTAGVRAVLSNIVIVDSDTMRADVAPAVEDINIFFDAAGPYDGVVSTEGMTLWSGGAPLACDPATGCNDVLLSREGIVVWEGDALVIASQSGGGPGACLNGTTPCTSDADCGGFVCEQAPVIACDPGDPAACADGAAGDCVANICVVPPVLITPFGPPILGGVPGGRDCQYDVNESLTLTATGTSVLLEWEAHSEAQGYQVFRCEPTSSPCAPQPLATTQDLFFVDDPGNADQVWYNVTAVGYPCPGNEFCHHSRCWSDGVCWRFLEICLDVPPFCSCDEMDDPGGCFPWNVNTWYFGTCQ